MAITAYTTSGAISQRVSADGLSLRVDDSGADINAVIDDASIEADGYALLLYSRTQLSQSDWYAKKVTDLAVYYLCQRRLNAVPDTAQANYDKAIADLEQVKTGFLQIPDCAMRKGLAPRVSNVRSKLYPFPHVVVEPKRSTGTAAGYVQNKDAYEFFDYGAGI